MSRSSGELTVVFRAVRHGGVDDAVGRLPDGQVGLAGELLGHGPSSFAADQLRANLVTRADRVRGLALNLVTFSVGSWVP